MNVADADVLILGDGLAALVTALSAAPREVVIVSPGESLGDIASTSRAQGGIAAAVGANDSPQMHADDTVAAGRLQNNRDAVRALCDEAGEAIRFLTRQGVRFDCDAAGEWTLHREAAHSVARVLHVHGDGTGRALIEQLRARCLEEKHIRVVSKARAMQLLTRRGAVIGARIRVGCGYTEVYARDTVLASGGCAGLYAKTTNPVTACGDGVAMALAAGARCQDLDLVQFHPTALAVEADPLPLVSEAVRGAGAWLVDENGGRFMLDVHPSAELAPRDVVARVVYEREQEGRHSYLRLPPSLQERVPESFPSLHALCERYALDLNRIPVTAAAHYVMGGVATDLLGRTSLPGLWAVGEAACTGVHGANRLASNSLLEAAVFGRRAGDALAANQGQQRLAMLSGAGALHAGNVGNIDSQALRQVMWQYLGVARTPKRLLAGREVIDCMQSAYRGRDAQFEGRLLLAREMFTAALRRLAAHASSELRHAHAS